MAQTKKPRASKQPVNDLAAINLTGEEISSLFMVSAARITQLMQAGHIPKSGLNSYPLVGAVQGMLRLLRGERTGKTKTAAAGRLQDAKARQVELANAEREGLLIETEEHKAVMEHVFGLLKTGLFGLPARLTRDITERRKIEDEINVILQQAIDALNKAADELETRGVVLDAQSEDDA